MRTNHRKSRVTALGLVITVGLVVAACGDDSGSKATTPAPATTAAPAATTAAPATTAASATTVAAADALLTAAKTAASAAGAPIALKQDITVGYLQWIYADEAGKRIEDAAKAAVTFLGWKYETCDAQGDPSKMPGCGNGLLDKGVNVIFTDGIPEAFITDVLERAKKAKVPVISAGGEVDPRVFYVASYASDDTDLGVLLAKHLNSLLPNGGNILVQSFPAAWSVKRQAGLAKTLNPNIKIVDTWQPDPANLVEGTAADVTTKLQKYGDIAAIWIDFSVASIGAANAVGALYPNAADPKRPKILTFYANPTTVADLKVGRVDAAVDEKLEWQSWAQADAIAELLARGTAPSQERAPLFGGLNFSARQVVTSANVPADGVIPAPAPGDYSVFFKAKWCAEFTNLPNCG